MPENKVELSNCAEDFLSYLEEERRYSPLTIKAYRRDLREFARFVDEYDPQQSRQPERIDRQTIRHFLGLLRER